MPEVEVDPSRLITRAFPPVATPPDPLVVHPPTPAQIVPPWQSIFISNPNQPPPPCLATRFFPPPPWPENLEGDNMTILPVVGPILALTPLQMATPPGFAGLLFTFGSPDPNLMEKIEQREAAVQEERREESFEERRGRRGRRRNGDREGWTGDGA